MKEVKVLELDKCEYGIILTALNEFRNKVLEEGKDSEPIDEILLKVLEAPDKKRMFPRKYVDER